MILNRSIIYVSGFTGFLLLTVYFIGLTADKSYNQIILISGLILVLLICIPTIYVERLRQNRKIDEIIHGNKKSRKIKIWHSSESGKNVKGWSMNNSPFRERNSGTSWGGGNIHGSLPKRQSRKGLFRN
jgi:hypothetical protein